MKVNAQSVNFVADRKLLDFIQKRMDKLERFHDRVIDADVYLKVKNTSAKENKIVGIEVSVPGNRFKIEKHGKSFEEAVDLACSPLERKLVGWKEKMRKKDGSKFPRDESESLEDESKFSEIYFD